MTQQKTRREARIDATAEIGKSISVKIEKSDDEDEDEVTRGHLKVKDLLVDRETIDLLIGWQAGRASLALYDESGAPRAYFGIALPGEYEIGGSIAGTAQSREKLVLSDAVLKRVQLDLCPLGAKLSGELVWSAAGDEVSDIEPLLGKLCWAQLVVRAEQQPDLFQDAA